MRIASKLTLALVIAALALFGTYGVFMLRMEERDLRRAAQREVDLLGRSLQAVVEGALRDDHPTDVSRVLRQLGAIDSSLDVWVFGTEGRLLANSTGARVRGRPPAIGADGLHVRGASLHWEPPERPEWLTSVVPLQTGTGAPLGHLILSRSLQDMRDDLAATQRGIVLSVAGFVAVTLLLGAFLGHTYITRPLGALATALESVEAGDLTEPTRLVGSRDEAGVLALKFRRMVNALRDARHRLDEETEARVRIQSGLQRADKLITIGQLSAGLAHEIGSPLQVLSGRARLLVDHAGDPGTVHRNAMVLVSQADRIAGIVDQLLKHARQRPMAMGAIDLVSLARTVADFLALEARRRGITLHLSHGPDIPPLTGDGDRLQQVVLNLLTNAFRATPRGGQVTMSIEGSRDSGVVRLRVTDTGPGVAVEIHSRLFEPFFTTRAAEGGTGLGLAVVKAIVTDHGGSVSFSSRPGGGASFWVELPVPGAVRAATTA